MNWCIACGPMFDDEHTKYCPLRSKESDKPEVEVSEGGKNDDQLEEQVRR